MTRLKCDLVFLLRRIKPFYTKLSFFFFSLLFFRTTFSEFASKHAKDHRFKAIDKMKDREAMFSEFMTAYRKKEKEDSKNKGEKVKF